MIPAAFGAIRSAVAALDNTLDADTLAALAPEDLCDAWRAAHDLADTADALYSKMRAAYATRLATASHPKNAGAATRGEEPF